MLVSHYELDDTGGEGCRTDYIVFPSGVVMYCDDDHGWRPSNLSREQVEDSPYAEFIDFIEAPCPERIK